MKGVFFTLCQQNSNQQHCCFILLILCECGRRKELMKCFSTPSTLNCTAATAAQRCRRISLLPRQTNLLKCCVDDAVSRAVWKKRWRALMVVVEVELWEEKCVAQTEIHKTWRQHGRTWQHYILVKWKLVMAKNGIKYPTKFDYVTISLLKSSQGIVQIPDANVFWMVSLCKNVLGHSENYCCKKSSKSKLFKRLKITCHIWQAVDIWW